MAKRRGNHEGSIYKRPNGKWQAQVTLEGKRLARTFPTQKESRDWIKEITRQKEKGLSLRGTKVTYGDYLQKWLQDIKPALKPKTWIQYEGIVRNHIRPALGEVKLIDLRPGMIQDLYAVKIRGGLGARTTELIHAVIHRSLVVAHKQGLITQNHANAVEKPKYVRGELNVLDEEQVQRLLVAAKATHIEALIHLAVTTGMRHGELLGLQWDDVDWALQELHIKRQLQQIPNEGFRLVSPKTKAGKRRIKLGDKAIRLLGKQLDHQDESKLRASAKWHEHNLIFPSRVGTPLEQKSLHRNFKKLLRNANLPNIRFHDLRHTAATLMLLHSIPILVVSQRLGHAKVSTTLDVYGHFVEGMQDEAAMLMNELVTPIAADLQQQKEHVS